MEKDENVKEPILLTAEQFVVQDLLAERRKVQILEDELSAKNRALASATADLRKIKEFFHTYGPAIREYNGTDDGGDYEMTTYFSVERWDSGRERENKLKTYDFMQKFFRVEEPDPVEEEEGDK